MPDPCPLTSHHYSSQGHHSLSMLLRPSKLTNHEIQRKNSVLLEFSAAFDSVDYFLLETLPYLGCHGNPLSWLFVASLRPFLLFLLFCLPTPGSSNVTMTHDSALGPLPFFSTLSPW